jgi:hypothetical protein
VPLKDKYGIFEIEKENTKENKKENKKENEEEGGEDFNHNNFKNISQAFYHKAHGIIIVGTPDEEKNPINL